MDKSDANTRCVDNDGGNNHDHEDDDGDDNDDDDEQDGGGEATVVNLLGVSIVVFVVLVLAIVTRQSFR